MENTKENMPFHMRATFHILTCEDINDVISHIYIVVCAKSKTLSLVYCVVPENIHTPPTEGFLVCTPYPLQISIPRGVFDDPPPTLRRTQHKLDAGAAAWAPTLCEKKLDFVDRRAG